MIGRLTLAGSFICLFIGFTIIGAALASVPPSQPPPKYVTATPAPRYTWICYDPAYPDVATIRRECQRIQLNPDGSANLTGEVRRQ